MVVVKFELDFLAAVRREDNISLNKKMNHLFAMEIQILMYKEKGGA